MKPTVLRILILRLGQFFPGHRQRALPNTQVFEERERPVSDYEMYYWGFIPAPWY